MSKEDEFFLARPHSWGWATWRNRWKQIDWSDDFLTRAAYTKETRKNLASMGLDLVPMLRSQLQGQINSWAITLCVHSSVMQLQNLYPKSSLTKNIGFGEDSTHTGDYLRRQPKLLLYVFKAIQKLAKKETLNLILSLISFKYYSQAPTKVEEKS